MKKNNNKLVNILIIIGIVFLLLSLVMMLIKRGNIENRIVDISYDEYSEMIKEDSYKIILLTTKTCSHCKNYKPIVNELANENDLEIYNLELDTLKYEEFMEIHDKYSKLKEKYNDDIPVIPTPVTIITKDGEEIAIELGNIGYTGFMKLLEKTK